MSSSDDINFGGGLTARARRDESGEDLIKRFTKMVRADGVLKEYVASTRFVKQRRKTCAK